VLVLVAGVAAVLLIAGSGGSESESGEPQAEAPENALREISKEGYERRATFEVDGEEAQGGEANRGGPNSPAAQAVADRAYPRTYVSDRRAEKTLDAFKAVPSDPSADSFGSRTDFQDATTNEQWTELGPFSPDVPGEPSQFFDPDTQTGPSTQEAGRVAAMAIDPDCTAGDCRMAVAAAGGGIWTTDNALATNVQWQAPPNDLPTTAFGSLYFDDASNVLYAGSGEPNGSSDSEAGLGLFRSTDFGDSWSLVPGSADVATDRSIGAIAVDPNDPNTIYIGTALARHGSSSVNGGRRTPPNAPTLGIYRSTDGGTTFQLEQDLSDKTLPDPTPPDTGLDFFAGGISKLLFDPNDPNELYAAVFGYGIWRADQSGPNPTWGQAFHTMNQNDFTGPDFIGDSTGDETEFDFADLGATTRMYVGDASDDWAIDGDDATPAPRAWRSDDVAAITTDADGILPPIPADPMGDTFNTANGFTELSSDDPADPGFAVYNYCQNGQCSYDSLVAHPPGSSPNTVWYLGSMNYDELKVYDRDGLGVPPRSNGRAVIRSTNAGSAPASINWADMTAVLANPNDDWDVQAGIHPDLRAAVFADNGDTAFIGGDGGVYRVDTSTTQDQSASCAQRTYDYDGDGTEEPLQPDDLALCQMLLNAVPNAVEPINDGLRTLQFQSLSANPASPSEQVFGGTQDNGTWSFDAARPQATRWFETVGGDGGQSGFDQSGGPIRYHNYYDATPEVNFHTDDPATWLDIYDPLQLAPEARSFYTPFEVDPNVPGRLFTGLEHVWRTDDNGGDEADLIANGCLATDLDPERAEPCGDWVEMGANLTSTAFGATRAGQYVVATERAPSDDGTLWAATRTGRLFVTPNADDTPGAVQFRRIDTPQTPGRFVTGIAIDPADPNHAWISYTGYDAYTPLTPGHVFEATYDPTAHTATFKDLSNNLGDQPITALAVYGPDGTLYAGTDFGVLQLPAGSSEWVQAGSGLPKVATYGLTLSDSGRVLYAATHGRGAYSIPLPQVNPPDTSPKATLKKVKAVRLGKKSKFRGSATDDAGIDSARLKFGDHKSATVKLRDNGTFKLKHRYRKAGKYTARLIVIGKEGKKATAERKVRVKPKKKHRKK
jgi:hypothetical protein